jgi:hypothetical protein
LPTPGRKPRVTEEQLPKFEELVRSKNDWTAQALSDACQQQGGNTLSISTALLQECRSWYSDELVAQAGTRYSLSVKTQKTKYRLRNWKQYNRSLTQRTVRTIS